MLKAYAHWGEDFVDHLVGMFACAIVERDSGRVVLARDRLGIKPLYLAEVAGRAALRQHAAGAARGRRRRHLARPGRAAPLPELPRGRAGAADRPGRACASCRRRPCGSSSPTARRATGRYWQPPYTRDPAKAGWSAEDWEEAVLDALRLAVRRRMVADVEVGVLLSGGVDSSLVVGLLAEQGQPDLRTFSIGFDAVGGRSGDEFQYSDLIARALRHQAHAAARAARGRPARRSTAPSPRWASRWSATTSSRSTCCRRRSRSTSGSCSPGRAPTRCSPATTGTRRCSARRTRSSTYAAAFFDRDDAGRAGAAAARVARRRRREPALRRGALRPAATPTPPLDRALRLDTEVMLVDDPVKRVDNTTMAFGLEARVPFLDHELVELAAQCPPELKLAHGGKGVLKQAARRVIPSEVIDRPKGYFPVPALTHLEGGFLDRVRDALTVVRGEGARAVPAGGRRPAARRPERRRSPRSAATRCGSSPCSRCGCRAEGV